MFKVFVFDDYEGLSQKAFEVMEEVVKQDKVTLGLATGSSPVGLYKRLVEAHKNGLSFKNVQSFNLDEYVGLSKNHDQSYYHFMFEHLFKHVDFNLENVHLPKGEGSLEDVAEEYEAMLKQNPQDLQLLGIGSNGHIGFNEPGTSFESTVHVVRLKDETRQDNARFFGSIDDVPHFAITMGIQDILRAKKILLVASGKNKAVAIKEMLEGKIREEVPCTILQSHPDVIVVLDKEAASLIKHD
ncbi:MAG TPA: glucosamine-6-phosphate deaminase [Erysipelotrichaceae bacterium]|jgi:glucosamine-6-phosphate deaminase|nr:glucosamine-6-phosphate deaminase [Erysipelotrichaceae bacterium]